MVLHRRQAQAMLPEVCDESGEATWELHPPEGDHTDLPQARGEGLTAVSQVEEDLKVPQNQERRPEQGCHHERDGNLLLQGKDYFEAGEE